jgi:hypothetical protein
VPGFHVSKLSGFSGFATVNDISAIILLIALLQRPSTRLRKTINLALFMIRHIISVALLVGGNTCVVGAICAL